MIYVIILLLCGIIGYKWLRKYIMKAIVIQGSDFPVTNSIIKKDALFNFDMVDSSWEEVINVIPYNEATSIIKTIRNNSLSFFLDQIDYVLVIIRGMEVVKIKLNIEKSRNRSLVVKMNYNSLLSSVKFGLL